MAVRPYTQKSVFDLEEIFSRSTNDPNELVRLSDELDFRRTPKARALKQKVEEALDQLAQLNVVQVSPFRTEEGCFASVRKKTPSTGQRLATSRKMVAVSPTSAIAPPMQHKSTGNFEACPLPSFFPSTEMNDVRAILAAWITCEALSPQNYRCPKDMADGDQSRIVSLEGDIPWNPTVRSKPDHKLYFEIILGAIALDKATDELVRAFGKDDESPRPKGRKAAIASIMIDKAGYVLEGNAIAVSSFAWALKPALDLKLGGLGAWAKTERRIIEHLDLMVRRQNDDGEPIPLDLDVIHMAHQWLITQFNVPGYLVEAPTFAIKVFHHFKAKVPPEPSLLNSFYLEDLGQAAELIEMGNAGTGFLRYMGIGRPDQKVDVLSPTSSIEPFVAPALIPQARWPSKRGHPLVLLQQAAVNASRAELRHSPGIIGINGPPGTGKTTLLRDIVVGCVLDRATVMAGFDRPQDAFSTTGQKISLGPSSFLHFYRLDESLKGHEIVVASSNNKAVENVSKELPLKEANSRHEEMPYFKSISDLIANSKRTAYFEGNGVTGDPIETWGLIATALGKRSNISTFQQEFWWNLDGGFKTYLNAARGKDVTREIKDERTGEVIGRIMPSVVINEQPSINEDDAAAEWQKARAAFVDLKKSIDIEIANIESVRLEICKHKDAIIELKKLEHVRSQLDKTFMQIGLLSESYRQEHERVKLQFEHDKTFFDAHSAGRPGFFAQLFGTAAWKSWSLTQQMLLATLQQKAREVHGAERVHEYARTDWCNAQKELQCLGDDIARKKLAISKLETNTAQARSRLGERVIDDLFFERGQDHIHLTAPWLPDDLHRMREELFAAALAVHKAFIDASARRLWHNLGLLMSAMVAGAFESPAHRELLPDLWSSLFIVIPAVSTTFASVRTMFGDLPPESIGWLLIDEAGQTAPQHAVGAVMRARRSIVVGDPLQVPPVVTLPEKLSTEICRFLNVDQTQWSAPTASTQTLADQASRFQSTFVTDMGDREVGLPLLVHRRCQNPMFNVSNAIAYAGQMVHAVGPKCAGPIGSVLGPSRWIDVNGNAETKWCPDEGDVVLRMLGELAASGVTNPDLFVITPFKIVEQEMRRMLQRETDLLRSLCLKSHWCRDSVGTIHTFQGREADTVILLLGAPKAGQHRARQWAASPPNIINVAVSRAKQNLYVVGATAAWANAGTSLHVLQRELIPA